MSGKLCLTPTPTSPDIPNKVCVARCLQKRTQKLRQSSVTPAEEKLCRLYGGELGVMMQKICDLHINLSSA